MLSIQAKQNDDKIQIIGEFKTGSSITISSITNYLHFVRVWLAGTGQNAHINIPVNWQTYGLRDWEVQTTENVLHTTFKVENAENEIVQFVELLKYIESQLLPHVQEWEAKIETAKREYNERKQKAQNLTNLINTLLANQGTTK